MDILRRNRWVSSMWAAGAIEYPLINVPTVDFLSVCGVDVIGTWNYRP